LPQHKFCSPESSSFDDTSARHYGIVRSALPQQNKPIGANDMLIAAAALRCDATLATYNGHICLEKHKKRPAAYFIHKPIVTNSTTIKCVGLRKTRTKTK
jgi:hypothetical protein